MFSLEMALELTKGYKLKNGFIFSQIEFSVSDFSDFQIGKVWEVIESKLIKLRGALQVI